ncbi:MAG TPA: response regulator [Candidatus Nanoarchaeia archaeon]|nr:response regulator [Candidatus Nanoarchaeia archaeon]
MGKKRKSKAPIRAPEVEQTQKHTHTVLVADDEPMWRDDLCALLGQHYNVETVDDGRQAMARLKKPGIDALVTDGRMGLGPDGDEVALFARARYPCMPIVLSSFSPDAYAATLRGKRVYLHKKDVSDLPILDYLNEKLGN